MSDRVVLVTGAGAGFGRQIALTQARRGDRVFAGLRAIRGRNAAKAAALRDEATAAGLALEVVELDVDDDASVEHGVAAVLERAGHIDALVNNAAFGVLGPWETATSEDVKRQFETNVFGVFRVSRAVAPGMRERGGGTILNVSSDAGFNALFFESIYAASKFALEGLTRGMRWELQQFGIRVCMVNPGWYRTSFGANATQSIDPRHPDGPYAALYRHFSAVHPRKLAPREDLQEVADAVAALLEQDDPPLHTPVGVMPLLMLETQGASPAEYERELFEYYAAEAFRLPSART
jgi:NAD(P)-dependent dehydrogenase (short-subunit alcohol dehydrogenase family)